ncbi:hypothetical protein H6P81_005166 [Aristolochia fimbriata]|uniref:Major facilitator superfamily (MFS) profile domain-containing protein n=1 Tax=Aristolochia fimbriata TaxID=158543 RepID=A0AAV7EX81_ARIFI|nr:hypothetical protein H6P81_005166 [Aristolochia fimbriata]
MAIEEGSEGRKPEGYNGRITPLLVVSSVTATMGGLLFGYALGISGGITSMEPFLKKFFPNVYREMQAEYSSVGNYCRFDSQLVTAFTSSLYVAGLVASFFAAPVTRAFGRKWSNLFAGITFLVGAGVGGAAVDVYMLVLSRVLLGIGTAFANQSIPIYISEISPPEHRGAINNGFNMFTAIGAFAANILNYGTQKISAGYGWRVSLAMAGLPASLIIAGAFILPETPSSLIQRGAEPQKALAALQKIRGTADVETELEDLIKAANSVSEKMEHPFRQIVERQYRPQLVMAIALPFFQQATGINVINFYAPLLFRTIGQGESSALMSTVATGLVRVGFTMMSSFVVDRLGRRVLFVVGGGVMLVSNLIVGGILGTQLGDHGRVSDGYAYSILVLLSIYLAGFGCSWGPLPGSVPAEIFQLDIRSAGQSITVAVSFFFIGVGAQSFLTMLCHFKSGMFFFFAGWILVMTVFVYLLLPETKNVPLERMERVWIEHWFWSRIRTGHHYNGRMTPFVILSCLTAAMGGLIFGYDIGISGGVTSMEPFLTEFFPEVYHKLKEDSTVSNYCKFDSQLLTSFTSSLYLAGMVASFFASSVTSAFGRKPSIAMGGVLFLVGSAVGAAAVNVFMLIIGRMLLGIGVGFANQAVPLYLSEMAPPKYRGAINNGFQLSICIGAFAANLINYGVEKIKVGYGWRISLAMGGVPASLLIVGALFLPETPNSLIQQEGNEHEALKMLQKVRGMEDVRAEFEDLIKANEVAKTVKNPFRNIIRRRYRPQLVMAIAIPFFQQVTGINVISFYAPLLFITIGLGESASLMSTIVIVVVGTSSTIVSMAVVDRLGRRSLLIAGGIQMLVSQVAIGGIMAIQLGDYGGLSKGYAYLLLTLISVYVAGFSWSWGPLGWLVPSEIFPMEVRSAGQSVTVAVCFLLTFAVAQTFLSMLCHFRWGIFLFFGGWVVVMTGFVHLLLPETKGTPIEQMEGVWMDHWFWKRFVIAADDQKEMAGAEA